MLGILKKKKKCFNLFKGISTFSGFETKTITILANLKTILLFYDLDEYCRMINNHGCWAIYIKHLY